MFSTRFITFLFLFVSFGMFASAKPIAIANAPSDLVARGGSCYTGGCNESPLLNVLVDLKAKVTAQVALFDGINVPVDACNTIIADINAAVKVILAIDVDASGAHGANYNEIAVTIAAIIQLIIGGCKKYTLAVILSLCLQLNVCLGAFLHACGGLIPGLITLVGTLIVDIEACLNLHLVLVVRLCGLLQLLQPSSY